MTVLRYCIFIISALVLLLNPDVSRIGIQHGLDICIKSILPSLFPYIVLTNLWFGSGYDHQINRKFAPIAAKVFHLPEAATSVIMLGCIGGFPLGGQSAIRMYEEGRLSKENAEQLLFFCSNAGPAFVLGVVGNYLFHSIWIGSVLWIVHVISAILLGIIFRPKQASAAGLLDLRETHVSNKVAVFTSSATNAGRTLAQICLYILIFSVINAHIENILPSGCGSPIAVLSGCLELSSGISLLQSFPKSTAFVAAAGLLAWNGCCVHMQVLSVIGRKRLSVRKYFSGKLLHVCLNVAIACCVVSTMPFEEACSAMFQSRSAHIPALLFLLPLAAVITKTATGKEESFRI